MLNKYIIYGLLFLYTSTYSQNIKLEGSVFDKFTGKCLGCAVIHSASSINGTFSNTEGCFGINLVSGENIFITSEIGYKSDTLIIDPHGESVRVQIFLEPSLNQHDEISITRQILSAEDIMIKGIKTKETENDSLTNYEFHAFNRCFIKENNNVGIGSGNFRMDFDEVKESFKLISNLWDSTEMKINGLNEYVSRGFYEKPCNFREIIEAQRTHSSLPGSLASLMGTRRIQNLYCDELRFYDRPIPGPFSHDALKYYSFSLLDTLRMDSYRVFKIYFQPKDLNDPGLYGYIYISENGFCPIKIEAELNTAAFTGGSFEKVTVSQRFQPYINNIYLPVDYRMTASSSYIGVVKIEYDFSSVMADYKINSSVPENFSGGAIFAVLPGAEKRDSSYWNNQQSIPMTPEELTAYEKIDSLKSAPKGFIYNAAKIFSAQYQLDDHYSVSGPFGIYQFNHVEGHTLFFTGAGRNLIDKKLDARITLSNGFSDKKLKESVSAIYYPGEERSFRVLFNGYNKLATLFSSSDPYSSLTSTILSLFSRHDFRNYFYTKGFDLGTEGELSHVVTFNAEYSNHTDNSAYTNTTFALLGGKQSNFTSRSNSTLLDSVNVPIYEARLNTLSFGVNFDFRDFISENYLRRKVSNGSAFVSFGAGIMISDPKILKSSVGFISYDFNMLGEINTFNSASLGFKITGIYSDGPVPFQMQYALPGNISATGRSFTFRSVGVSNMFGDQTLTLNLEHNFREETARIIPIRFLKNLRLTTFFNAAWKNMSDKSAAIMPVPFTTLRNPLFEAGFSIGYAAIPASIELAWRLNHIDRSAFRIGINTSIL
jgi:hypothetical protein